jgi:tetratricopeptide (TPR) repeat protein
MLSMNYMAEAKEVIDPAIGPAREMGDESINSRIYTIMGMYKCYVEEELEEAICYLEKAMTISAESNDIASMHNVRPFLALAQLWSGQFEKSNIHYVKSINSLRENQILWRLSTVISNLSTSYLLNGRLTLACQTSEEAIRIAEESGDMFSKALAFMVYGNCRFYRGFHEDAEAFFRKTIELCETMNHVSFAAQCHLVLGELYFDRGEYQRATDHYAASIYYFKQGRILPSQGRLATVGLHKSKAMKDKNELDIESISDYPGKNKLVNLEGWTLRYLGEVYLIDNDQNMAKAEACISKAIEADEQNKTMWHLGKDYALYADLFKRKGDLPKARVHLGKAIEILKECGADGWVEKYEKELAAIS